jgi:hypothetical protein
MHWQPAAAYPAEPVAAAEPDASMARAHFCQRSSLPHRVFSTRRNRQGLVSGVPSPPERTARSRALVPLRTTKTASAHRSIERRGLPWSETPSAGWRPLSSPHRSRRAPCARAVRPPALFHPSRVPLRASSTRTPSAATEGAHTERSATKPTSATVKEHGHTDCDGTSLRTEPAVSAHSVVPVRAGTANGTTSGADAPCARGQGRHRPAAPRVSLRDRIAQRPTRNELPSTSLSLAMPLLQDLVAWSNAPRTEA